MLRRINQSSFFDVVSDPQDSMPVITDTQWYTYWFGDLIPLSWGEMQIVQRCPLMSFSAFEVLQPKLLAAHGSRVIVWLSSPTKPAQPYVHTFCFCVLDLPIFLHFCFPKICSDFQICWIPKPTRCLCTWSCNTNLPFLRRDHSFPLKSSVNSSLKAGGYSMILRISYPFPTQRDLRTWSCSESTIVFSLVSHVTKNHCLFQHPREKKNKPPHYGR